MSIHLLTEFLDPDSSYNLVVRLLRRISSKYGVYADVRRAQYISAHNKAKREAAITLDGAIKPDDGDAFQCFLDYLVQYSSLNEAFRASNGPILVRHTARKEVGTLIKAYADVMLPILVVAEILKEIVEAESPRFLLSDNMTIPEPFAEKSELEIARFCRRVKKDKDRDLLSPTWRLEAGLLTDAERAG